MRTYRIDRLNTDGTRTPDIGRAELPDDKTTYGFAVAFVAWVDRNRGGDPGGCGYEAVAVDDQAGAGVTKRNRSGKEATQ